MTAPDHPDGVSPFGDPRRAGLDGAPTALTLALRDVVRRDEEIARKDEALEKAHRELGARAYVIRDLTWRLERARERLAELEQKLSEVET